MTKTDVGRTVNVWFEGRWVVTLIAHDCDICGETVTKNERAHHVSGELNRRRHVGWQHEACWKSLLNEEHARALPTVVYLAWIAEGTLAV